MAFFTLSIDPEVSDNPDSPTDMVGADELRKDNEMSIVTTMSTAELLAYYNTHSGKPPVKRFADRKTAEKRVSDLITSKSKETEEMAKKETKAKAAPKKAAKAAPKKAASKKGAWGGWKRAAVLYGKDHYLSLPLAFQALKLPMSRVRPARKKLKAEGTLAFEFNGKTFNFKLAPVAATE